MSLRVTIEEKYIKSVKNKNTNEVNTLRLIKSAIKDKDIASRTEKNKEGISSDNILTLLQSLIKQRKDSIESFKAANREDLIIIEQKEIDIISTFLPKQLDVKETESVIEKIVKDQNLLTLKDMGKLMGKLKESYAGTIDMALAGKIAKSKLTK